VPDVIPADRCSVSSHVFQVDGLTVSHSRFSACGAGWHAHERTMCTLTLEGHWAQGFRGSLNRCTPGTIITKEGCETHFDRIDDPGIEVLMIELEPGRVEHLGACIRMLLEAPCQGTAGVLPLGWRLVRELAQPNELTPVVVEGLVLELFGTAAARRLPSLPRERTPPPWLDGARELILGNLDRPLSITDLARAVDVHPVRLARAFRTFYGISPSDYLRRARVDRAAGELITTDRRLADIALAGGFADQSHFTRVFKRHTGQTPGQYRRSARPGWMPDDEA
jgi:AraC family transcriptional regulator